MQPPPQAVPSSSVVGPPPAGTPQSTFWLSSPYRRQAAHSGPAAPVPCPVQPVTDPFAFSRQALQNPAVGSTSHSGPPGLQNLTSSTSLQHPGQPLRPLSATHGSHGPLEPLPRPLSQPKPETSPFSSLVVPSAPPGLGMNRGTEAASSSEPQVHTLPYLPQYIPAAPDVSVGGHLSGNVPGSGQNLHAAAVPPAVPPSFPLPGQPMPGQWGPAQGGVPPSTHHSWPCPEGPVPVTVPPASRAAHFPASLHQGPSHESGNSPGFVPAPGTSLQSGNPSVTSLHPENTFRRDSRAGTGPASQELRPTLGMTREQTPASALANPAAQGNSSESHLLPPGGPRPGHALPQGDSGSLSVFFQGGETENEENLSYEKPGSAGPAALDGVAPNPASGHPGAHSALLRSSNSESMQPGGDAQAYFSQSVGVQHERQTMKSATPDLWGDAARAGAPEAGGPHYENVENLEFVQNQEVLPSETLGVEPALSDQPRYGPLPGPASSRLGAPDTAPPPVRPDSASSGHSSRSLRTLPGAGRPQDLVGTFIQKEVGKPEDEASGNFFKQIDSSPVGGEVDEAPGGQSYRSSLSQPPTPSPPKPTGVFQTSANSSFEPVKSHLVGIKPVEADRANVVGEVRDTHGQQKQSKVATAPPDVSLGNLEQPPDNMETLFMPQDGSLPSSAAKEASHGLPHAVGPPLDTALPTPEKRSLTRAQGVVKCESPATTLWAQSELPDFGGNVLLAPAAPMLQVPVNPRPLEVIQPPDEGVFGQQPSSRPPLQGGDALGASENLENPPKMGEEETLPSQASSGYASLLPSPPTEPLADQPVLRARPGNSPASPLMPAKKSQGCREAVVGEESMPSSRAAWANSGDPAPLPETLSRSPCSPLLHRWAPSHCPQVPGPSEMVSNQPTALLVQPAHLASKNLLPGIPRMPPAENMLAQVLSCAGRAAVPSVPPACSASGPWSAKGNASSSWEETGGPLDLSLPRALESPVRMYRLAHSDPMARCPGPGAHNPDPFYQQVTRDAQEPQGPDKAQLDPAPPPLPGPRAAPPEPSDVGSTPGPGLSQNSAQSSASLTPTDTGQQPPPPRPPPTSSMAVVATTPSQTAMRPDQQWPQSPPPDYYYYRPLYDGYQPQYPSPYPPDPGSGPLYYQDVYGMYDPRYRPYDSAASAYAESYRYPEPERPSSRASHSSDRPPARREYPEGYYSSKGWSSQSDHYSYYSGQYDYGDLGRWGHYHYGSRSRDPRTYEQRFWHDADYDVYRKDSYAHGDRSDKYDDPWRYDPRFTGSFDDDPEPRRDPYGEEADRHSVHSEHSAPSLRSRRSSLSSHSHQSQMYRSHHVIGGSYDAPPPPGSFHGDYTYGAYGGAFPECGYPADASWPTVEQAPSRPTSPEKFPVPHLCARFGPGGQLIKVIPNLPSEGQPALVEIHSMESLLQHTPEQEEMRAFPGPLGKDDTHKVDVINFAQNKATKCLQDENLLDKESASLLWNFIVLLCRQNGTVVGTDIAELLLRDHKTVWLPGKSPNEANLIDFTHEAVGQAEEEESVEAQLSFLGGPPAPVSSLEKEVERFRELLLYGRKKDALESAMKNALWGHALLLASKMDSRTHARVMTRFANSLPINDPLQTVYQLMSGRMPAASTCCGDEKWGDWRPHLAMVLSNLSSNMDVESRTMVTMGDTLASKGLLDAAHFCYLMAQLGFGVYTKKAAKLVLIGSNHSLPFPKFATNEAIQRTEAYEYAQSLGAQPCTLPNFQVFKFIYSCRLAEMGLATQAFHYCEVIARSILARPHSHSPVLISQLVQVASQLRLFDPQLKERPEEESFVEPTWLVELQRVDEQVKEGAVVSQQDAASPQRCPSSPSSEVGSCEGPAPALPAGPGPDNPLLAPPMPPAEHLAQSVRLLPSAPNRLPSSQPVLPAGVPMFPVQPVPGPAAPGFAPGFPEPSGPDPTALYPGPGVPPGAPSLQEARSQEAGMTLQEAPSRNLLPELREGDAGGNPADLGAPRMPQDYEPSGGWEPPPPAPTLTQDVKRTGPAKKESKEPKKSSEPWFFSRWLYGKKRTEAYLPDDKNKSIVWDEKKNRWVDVNEPEEERKAPPPPPTSLLKAPQAVPPGPGGAPRASVNMFSRKAAGSRARYVDVLNPGGTQRSDPALAPADFFAPLAPLPIPALVQAGADTGPSADGEEPQGLGSAAPPQGGELSRCSSVSSLSREVSQHLHQALGDAPTAGAPGGAVPFYNPVQFTPVSATSGSSRAGRVGPRKQAALS